MRMSSAEFIANFKALNEQGLTETITITGEGRDQYVLLSAAEYARLKYRDRKVVRTGDLPESDRDLIAGTEMSPDHAYLNDELIWNR